VPSIDYPFPHPENEAEYEANRQAADEYNRREQGPSELTDEENDANGGDTMADRDYREVARNYFAIAEQYAQDVRQIAGIEQDLSVPESVKEIDRKRSERKRELVYMYTELADKAMALVMLDDALADSAALRDGSADNI
jgi:hypothetical protein